MLNRTISVSIALFVSAACQPSEDREASDTPVVAPDTSAKGVATRAQADTVPVLTAGCSGGVTGGGAGTFVTASGEFYRYQRNRPAPNAKRELTFVRRDSAEAARLVMAAEQAGITRIKYSVPANMTCHLTLDRSGTSYDVAWPMGVVPAEIRALVAVAKDLETTTAAK